MLRRILGSFMVLALLLVSTGEAYAAKASTLGAEVEATLIVRLGPPGEDSAVDVTFKRAKPGPEIIAITSLRLSDEDAPQEVQAEPRPEGAFASHVAGWFAQAVGERSLWMGLRLDSSRSEGRLRFFVPGLTRPRGDRNNSHEMLVSFSDETLPEYLAGAARIRYAKVVELRILEPEWGYIEKVSEPWSRRSGGTTTLRPDYEMQTSSSIVIKAYPNVFREWLDKRGGMFFFCFLLSLLFSTTTLSSQGGPSKSARTVMGALSALSVVVMLYISNWSPFDFRALFFDGAEAFGAFLSFSMCALAPKSVYGLLKRLGELVSTRT